MRSVSARVSTSASLLFLLAGTAAANPVPWVNIGPAVQSRGLYGEATNAVIGTPALPAGGPFNYMTISGDLTEVAGATFSGEACIEITMPSGQQFVVKPFDGGGFTGTVSVAPGTVTVPLNTSLGSGGATLRFFELYRDSTTGPDSNWTNFTITLHNSAGGDTVPLSTSITPTSNGPDVNGTWIYPCAKGITYGPSTLSFGTNMVAGKVHIRGYGTARGGWNANNSNSQLNFVNINITAPKADGSGPVTWTVAPFGGFAASSSQFDVVVNAPVPVLTGPGNDWSFTVTDNNAPAVANTQLAQIWMTFQPLLPDAPGATDIGTIRSRPALGPVESTPVSSTTFTRAANEVKWYTFNTEYPCSDASGFWLDIHTQIPAGSPIGDQELGMYDTSGNRLADNDDGGSGVRSQLSFGQTSPVRAPVDPTGGPYPRNGFSGTLPAGLHYLAVSQFNTIFADTGWYVYSTATTVGDMNFEIRTNLPPLIPPFTDLGTLAGALPAPPTVNIVPAEPVKWFRFDTPQPIDNVTRYYLDIDTIQAGAPFIDTMIGLYNQDGVVRAVDDDDGRNGNRSQLSFGIGPANRTPINDSLPGDGRDGNLAAGRYYVAACFWPSSFNNEWIVSAPAGTGTFPLNFHHNFPSAGCGPADVGSAGGAPGSDGLLNNNDFIAFINYFFASDPHADVGTAGGLVGSDGLYNNNDFIAFITLFFNGCP